MCAGPPHGWPANLTREARDLLRPGEVTALIQPPASTCQGALLLVVVTSDVAKFGARKAIRQSWARDTDSLSDVRVVFLVGLPQIDMEDTTKTLEKEAVQHHDIIQVGEIYTLHYYLISQINPRNLLLKTTQT